MQTSAIAADPASGPYLSTARPRGYGLVVLLVILLGIALATAVLIPLAQGRPVDWATLTGTYDWLVAVLIVLLVVAGLLTAMRLATGDSKARRDGFRTRRARRIAASPATPGDPALAIARERYARGEISSGQLDELVAQLDKNRGSDSEPSLPRRS